MDLPCYSDGTPIEPGDAVLRSGVVPARIIDVLDADPPAVMLEDAERPGRTVLTHDLWDLTLIERTTQDYARAGIDWLTTQAGAGDAQAQGALGWLYETGVAVEKDDAAALDWIARAAQGGDPASQFNFGLRFEFGRGVAIDMAQAARWYLASAEQGVAQAMANLSTLYRDGRGVEQNLQAAIRWMRAAENAARE